MKAWFDEDNVLWFEDGDLSPEEVLELSEMLIAAFDRGLRSGYRQGKAAVASQAAPTT